MTSVVRRVVDAHRTADPRLIGLFYGVLVVKVALLAVLLQVHPDALISPDTSTYVMSAWSLIEQGTFSRGGSPEILRTPGYPLFLVPFLAAFGTGYVPAVIVAHFLLVAAIAVLVYRMVLRLAPDGVAARRAARLAFAFVLIEPNLFFSEYNVGTDVLFAFLLSLAVYCLVRFVQDDEAWTQLLLGGLALTAGAFVRPIGLYLPYGLAAVGIAWFAVRARWRTVLAVSLVAVLHLGLTSAWSLRNQAHYGERVFTTISHVNLFEYYAASVKARAEGRSWGDTRDEFQQVWDRWEGNEAEKAVAAGDSAVKVLRSYPIQTGIVGLRGLATNVLDPGTGRLANTLKLREAGSGIIYKFVSMDPWSFVIYLVKNEKALVAFLGIGFLWLVFMWGTAIVGLIHTRVRPAHVLLLLIIGYVLVLGAGPQSMARFRVPATPFLLVYSALGAEVARARYRGE